MDVLRYMTDTLRGRRRPQTAKPILSGTEVSFTFEDYLAMRELAFEWGDSYDCKDRERLSKIIAPTVHVDYTQVLGYDYGSVPADQFVDFMFHPGFVGDPLVDTQHLLGGSKFVQVSSDVVHAYIQLRAAHQRYTDSTRQQVENKGHGHAMIRHEYRRIDGVWKFAGLRPEVRWNEFAFDKIFDHFDPSAIVKPDVQDMGAMTKSAV